MSNNTIYIKGGYILLSRKIIESEVWKKPPLYLKVWLWILSKAEYRDDNKDLKRGELIIDVNEIREACSYYVGYRRETPSYQEVYRIIDWFKHGENGGVYEYKHDEHEDKSDVNTNVNMIVNANVNTNVKNKKLYKVHRYHVYQDPKNYERKDEGKHESKNEHKDEKTTNVEPSIIKRNKELKESKNIKNNTIGVGVDYNNQDFSIIVNEWQKLGFGMITERSTEQILDWLKDHDKDLIMHVIQYAHDNGAINQRYVQAVLKSAREKNVKTVADFESEQQKRAAQRKTFNYKSNNQVIQPKWFNEKKEVDEPKELPKDTKTDTDINNMINQFRKGQTP